MGTKLIFLVKLKLSCNYDNSLELKLAATYVS